MDAWILCCLTLLLIYFVHAILRYWKERNVPPGPWGLPFVGCLPFLHIDLMHRSFAKIAKKYGPLFSIRIGSRLVIALNDTATIKMALSKTELSGRPLDYPFSLIREGMYGIGMRTYELSGRQTASVFLKAFGRVRSYYDDVIIDKISTIIDQFATAAETGKSIRMVHDQIEMFDIVVFDIIWSAIVRTEVPAFDLKTSEIIMHGFHDFVETFHYLSVALFFPSLKYVLPNADRYKHSLRGLRILEETTMRIIEERKRKRDVGNPRDIVDFLLDARDQSNEHIAGITNEPDMHLACIVTDLMIAGASQQANGIRWGLYLLASRPDVQIKMQQEIDSTFGREAPALYCDRERLPYSHAVVHDAMRIASMSPFGLFHIAEAKCQLMGYEIPKGALIVGNMMPDHRDANIWKSPSAFEPDNFLTDTGEFDAQKLDFIAPFFHGKRMCPGANVTKTLLFNTYTLLMQRFNFHLAKDFKFTLDSPTEMARVHPAFEIYITKRK